MFDSLLKKFENIPPAKKKADDTLFDICGIPHHENVISNVLAFFFDDSNDHDVKGLLAKSLFEAAEIDDRNLDLQFQAEREVRTKSGKFIDILLTNDSICIVLENKIWAPLNNDLDDYWRHATTRDKDKTYGIVLSMRKIDTGPSKFTNVLYSEFIRKMRGNLGKFIGRQHNHHLLLLIDLMNNIENLYEGGTPMNDEFISFIRREHADVQRFGKELKTYHDDLRKIVKQVNAIVIELVQDSSVKQSLWRNLPDLRDVAVTDFDIENGVGLAIDSVVDPTKWEFQVFYRDTSGVSNNIVDYCKAKQLDGSKSGERFVLTKTLPLETDPTEVARTIVELINSLRV